MESNSNNKQTNFEYIKAMTPDEFFKFMVKTNLDRCFCPVREVCHQHISCRACFIAWLNSDRTETTWF